MCITQRWQQRRTKIKYIYWIMRDCLIVSMCRDVVTSFEELLCAGVGCRPGYQGGAGQGRGHNQKTREQAASLHQPHRGTCTVHTSHMPAGGLHPQLVSTCLYRFCWGTYISCSINCVPSPSESPATEQLHETGN